MLFVIHKRDHPELNYKGGQDPILHLEADLRKTVKWAQNEKVRWAFTLSNAASMDCEYRSDLAQLDEINWKGVRANQWSAPTIKEGKQAEFLIESFFAWELVDRIGVASSRMKTKVIERIEESQHRPVVSTLPEWYY